MRIRAIREDHDLTQKEVAYMLGIKQQQYSRYETGENEITIPMLIKLAIFYRVSTDYLLELTNVKERAEKKENN